MDELDQEVIEEPEAAPVPEVAPEPEVELEPAEEFHYQPDFLSDHIAPGPVAPQVPQQVPQPPPQQQWSPQQVAAYNQQGADAKRGLDRLIDDPMGTIDERARMAAQQEAYMAMQHAVNPMAARMEEFIQGQTGYMASEAKKRVGQMYSSTFNKDETFASNERVQKRVDAAMQGLLHNATAEASRGNMRGFAVFSDPTLAEATLAVARIIEGQAPRATGSVSPPHVESAAPATQKQQVELSPDMESALSKLGPNGEERYRKALEDAEKYGDFEG